MKKNGVNPQVRGTYLCTWVFVNTQRAIGKMSRYSEAQQGAWDPANIPRACKNGRSIHSLWLS